MNFIFIRSASHLKDHFSSHLNFQNKLLKLLLLLSCIIFVKYSKQHPKLSIYATILKPNIFFPAPTTYETMYRYTFLKIGSTFQKFKVPTKEFQKRKLRSTYIYIYLHRRSSKELPIKVIPKNSTTKMRSRKELMLNKYAYHEENEGEKEKVIRSVTKFRLCHQNF